MSSCAAVAAPLSSANTIGTSAAPLHAVTRPAARIAASLVFGITGLHVHEDCEHAQLWRALFTVLTRSLIPSVPSPDASAAGHEDSPALPSAMFTPVISSSMLTLPLRLQSPPHASG